MPFIFNRGSIAVVEVHGVIGARVRETVYERIFDSVARNKRYRAPITPGTSTTAILPRLNVKGT